MSVCANGPDWLLLAAMPGIGRATLGRLVVEGRPPGEILGAPERLAEISPRLVAILSDRTLREQARRRVDRQLDQLHRHRISLTCPGDSHYPPHLLHLPEPPALLFYRGTISSLSTPCVALVGSRAATSYGCTAARSLASGLAAGSVTVVSGLALGIDTAAHQGALAGGGPTAAVLGCGIDVIYPRANRKLYDEIAANGVLLSEYPCGIRPDGFRFPERNRIISGLSLGVVVVEATLKSGSLITARLALDQGREVFAVPGRIDSPKSDGPHRLIRQGALLVRNAGDILDELGLKETAPPPAAPAMPPLARKELEVLGALDVYPVDIDSLQQVTGLETAVLLDLLLQLELKGMVRQLHGQLYEKTWEG